MPIPTENVQLNAIDICHPGKCAGCAPGEECRSAVVSDSDTSFSYVYTNVGTEISAWEAHHAANYNDDLLDVVCLGGFIMAISAGANTGFPIIRSYDNGDTWTQLAGNTDMATHTPRAIDAIDMNRIIIVGNDGYIYLSVDQGNTWATVMVGTLDLTEVMICRQNPNIVYATGEEGNVMKSTDGGDHWFTVYDTNGVGDDASALWVINPNDLLIGDNYPEILESTDGGVTWTAQILPPAMPNIGTVTSIRCCGCGSAPSSGACVMTVAGDGVNTGHYIFRNAGWASGQWEEVQGGSDMAAPILDIGCCSNNLMIAVGGETTQGLIAVLS